MKILVITFSKGLNPGTFLQAFGVKYGMSRIFPEAVIEYLEFFKPYCATKISERRKTTNKIEK